MLHQFQVTKATVAMASPKRGLPHAVNTEAVVAAGMFADCENQALSDGHTTVRTTTVNRTHQEGAGPRIQRWYVVPIYETNKSLGSSTNMLIRHDMVMRFPARAIIVDQMR